MLSRRRLKNRYEILEERSPNLFRGYDIERNEIILIRRVIFPLQSDPERWREGVRKLLSIRHPNFLNILALVSDQAQDYVVTEYSSGIAASDLRKAGVQFTPDEALRLLLGLGGGFDLAAQYTLLPNFISSSGLFIESNDSSELRQVRPSDWPPVCLKLDIFTLLKPTLFSVPFPEDQEVTSLAVRQAALMLYNLLSGTQPKHGAVNLWFKPIPALTEAANSALFGGLEWSPVFEDSENFLRSVDFANRTQALKKSNALPGLINLSKPGKRRYLTGFGLSGSVLVFAAGAVFAATLFALFPPNRPHLPALLERASMAKIAEPLAAPPAVESSPLKAEVPPAAHLITEEPVPPATPVPTVDPPTEVARPAQIPLIVPMAPPKETTVPGPDVPQDRGRIVKKTRPHARGETNFSTKQELLTDVDSKWIPKEVAANLRVATLNAKIGAASGTEKGRLTKYRDYLKKREAYTRRMHRYQKDIARRSWNREHGTVSVMDSIVATLGF
jgi:hypothetical protein